MQISVRDNLIMRSLTKCDAPDVYAAVDSNRAHLRVWLPWVDSTDSPAVTESVIATWEKDYENKTDIVLGIFENNVYVGNIGLHNINKSNNSGMVGYWLAEKYQGRGIVTDCVRALVNFGFNNLELNRIYLYCASENTKSRAIPERLSFIHEGTLQDGEYVNGAYYDLIVYGMVRRNWK